MAENAKSLDGTVGQLTQFVRGLSLKQQLLLAGATLLVAGTLFVFVRLMSSPDIKPLVTGMKPEDAQQLASRLSSKNIQNQLSQDGTSVSVPADELDKARLETVSDGTPRSGRLGFELFDKPNWGGSDFSEKVNYQRALEGELERTIQTLRDIDTVRVHLVVPPESVFVDRGREAKASVTLRLRGRHLNPASRTAIANLVAGAVDRLRPENVSVIDADTNRELWRDADDSQGSGNMEDAMAQRLRDTLEPVVGAGRIRASVHLERDLTSGEETQEIYDPNTTVALTMQRSEERSGAPLPGGIPGTSSNVPGSTSNALGKTSQDETTQSSKSESGSYAVNRTVRHTVLPAGRMKRVTAAILVDDALEIQQENGKPKETSRKRTAEELKQIEELARASLGIDVSRGDTITVQNLAFESIPAEQPSPVSLPERIQTSVLQWSRVLRYAGIVLLFFVVYFLFLRPVKKQVLATLREGGLKPSTRLQAQSSEKSEALQPDNPGSELTRLKKQLVDKAKAEPASTSRLLQSWLREEGKA